MHRSGLTSHTVFPFDLLFELPREEYRRKPNVLLNLSIEVSHSRRVENPLVSHSWRVENPLVFHSWRVENPLVSNSRSVKNPLVSNSRSVENPLVSSNPQLMVQPKSPRKLSLPSDSPSGQPVRVAKGLMSVIPCSVVLWDSVARVAVSALDPLIQRGLWLIRGRCANLMVSFFFVSFFSTLLRLPGSRAGEREKPVFLVFTESSKWSSHAQLQNTPTQMLCLCHKSPPKGSKT